MSTSEASFKEHYREFLGAVYQLTQSRYHMHIDEESGKRTFHSRPSVYDELDASLEGAQGTHQGVSIARSLPPVWVDGLKWKVEVDMEVGRWANRWADQLRDEKGAMPVGAPAILQAMEKIAFAPEHHELLGHYTHSLLRWTQRGESLLAGRTTFGMRNSACPECGTKHVRRQDEEGRWGKTEALQISPTGAICLACRRRWDSKHFALLGRLLGCTPLPELEDEVA